MIKSIGEETFENSQQWDYLKDVSIPFCFNGIFTVFLELYNNSSTENGFTWQDIDSYCNVRKVELSQIEIDYIMKCKRWANSEVSKLRKDEE